MAVKCGKCGTSFGCGCMLEKGLCSGCRVKLEQEKQAKEFQQSKTQK